MRIQAVFFDLFETLITEFEDGQRKTVRSVDYFELFGLRNEDFKLEWGNRQVQRMTGLLPNYISAIQDILESRHLKIDSQVLGRLYHDRILEKKIPFQQIHPEIIRTLDRLRAMDVKLGIISNCSEEEVRHWQECELAGYFDDVIFSYEVGSAKPDGQIYKLACERLEVAPGQSIFVGDGGSKELDGASKAGLLPFHAFWFNTYIESSYKKLLNPEQLLDELAVLSNQPGPG